MSGATPIDHARASPVEASADAPALHRETFLIPEGGFATNETENPEWRPGISQHLSQNVREMVVVTKRQMAQKVPIPFLKCFNHNLLAPEYEAIVREGERSRQGQALSTMAK